MVKALGKEAEALRWRELVWSLIPPLSRKMVLPYLTLRETLRLDIAVTEKGDEKNPGDRDHLMKGYRGLCSAGFNEWIFKDTNDFEGVRWAMKRGIDLRELKLEYVGERDGDQVLGQLVMDKNKEMATYFAVRSAARDSRVGEDIFNYSIGAISTTLIEAVKEGYLEVVQALLGARADVNKANEYGETPLHSASQHGHLEVLQALLGAEADVNKADNDGETPLHSASQHGHLEVVQALLGAGADVNETDNDGKTPLYWASYHGHLEVVQALLGAGADVNKADNGGKTPLYLTLYSSWRVAMLLLEAGCNDRVAAVLREAGGHE